ncbi:MAG TPA: hypothetical protein VK466_07590 [Terriglobales bacterium]|nr:hypothetical protein [Terriglobales bacterium]
MMDDINACFRAPAIAAPEQKQRFDDVEMTFDEIGRVLGISTHCAEVHYRNGMKKLRSKHPRALQWLRCLAEERVALVQERRKGAGGIGVEG